MEQMREKHHSLQNKVKRRKDGVTVETETALHTLRASKGEAIHQIHLALSRIKDYMERIQGAKYVSLEERIEVRRSELHKLKASREKTFGSLKQRLDQLN